MKLQGFKNVEILERSNRIGGKVYDVKYRGITQPMTFYFILPDYIEVKKLISNFSTGEEKMQPGRQ